MKISTWEDVCERLRAALIQAYPRTAWRVEFFADKGDPDPNEFSGVAVHARRGNTEREIRLSLTVIQRERLSTIVSQISAATETAFKQYG